MNGEKILDILIPNNEDGFMMLKTTNSYYELRMGGYIRLDKINTNMYEPVEEPSWKNKKVERVFSDHHLLYIEDGDGGAFSYGPSFMDENGRNSFALDYYSKEEFRDILEEIYSDEEFHEIKPV
ncbi:hypothetical protein HNP38_003047 [Chryseobacterium defluvii]|uniref:Uncharacterized protein n=1 Tax=Chryseobacterium defluvii TaxID=160396 RepID=A0A840KEA8_9FLAO|nr:hypothetical protein [Chryseobacterium defluvii]MBB4807731.1 hypothetical protein [Chryseobacterium defluvii]